VWVFYYSVSDQTHANSMTSGHELLLAWAGLAMVAYAWLLAFDWLSGHESR